MNQSKFEAVLTKARPLCVAPPLDVVTKEQAPPFTFAVWEPNGKICLLAKIAATFTISYPSNSGTQKKGR
ncbi:LAMP5 [Cordylochernes scorpioides]|uniref:LAMP5 n=1 Tax=Cordylochernes scorpioides TaxID=51811 RepID=A0ABY6L2U4_9ARAC|nr:LAMP5 [Cordylochernes scorpioides]